jgi:hypothetical protein
MPLIKCPICKTAYVDNTVFCANCGSYLSKDRPRATDPLEPEGTGRTRKDDPSTVSERASPEIGPLTVRLRIGALGPSLDRRPPKAPSTVRLSASQLSAKRQAEPRKALDQPDQGHKIRQLEVTLSRPIRLGRVDPQRGIYPEVDLTEDYAQQYGVSREHACIFQRKNAVEVSDLGSTNGTLLNNKRLAPFTPQPLSDGDQLQLGMLLIEVSLSS